MEDQILKDVSADFVDEAAKVVQSSSAGRSVVDYEDPEQLRYALESSQISAGIPCAEPPQGKSDWVLPVPDPDAHAQTVEDEMQRLLTLKSYLLLDAAKEEAFDKLTREACQIYDVPTSLISLVDLGRQFFLSNTGVADDVRETTRTSAFCSHTILSKTGICVVPDTYEDARFQKNCMVTDGAKLRFYAGAPLISPEGYKLGTFCVEGPEPRPQGLSQAEQQKLKDFAAKAMSLMVDRRKTMRRAYDVANMPANVHLRRHAAVTSNLGTLVYKHNSLEESVTAMKLFQESVQTLMHIEEETADSGVALPSKERRQRMSKLFEELSSASTGHDGDEVLKKIHTMYSNERTPLQGMKANNFSADGIPGLFNAGSRLKGVPPKMNGLFFSEAFDISLEIAKAYDPKDPHSNLDDRSFIIPLEQCSKATLFNMGLIHYKWGSADSAMQFFDLAASLSQQHNATDFDPVVLACLNNMAQIHLQYGRSTDAMELLTDAMARGNAALTTIYSYDGEDSDDKQERDQRWTKRLRRKLCRTVLNMGHVHYSQCKYDDAMHACHDAIKLLHTNMDEEEVAAIWFNMALLQYYQGHKEDALVKLDRFLELAKSLLPDGPHIQLSDALFRKGKILFELNDLHACMEPLNEAITMRKVLLGENNPEIADSLCIVGKIFHARGEYASALDSLDQALALQRNALVANTTSSGQEQVLSFDIAQTLLDIGRTFHVQNRLNDALKAYLEVLEMTCKFFGRRHPFVARIDKIVGNLYVELGKKEESVAYLTEAESIDEEHGLPTEG